MTANANFDTFDRCLDWVEKKVGGGQEAIG